MLSALFLVFSYDHEISPALSDGRFFRGSQLSERYGDKYCTTIMLMSFFFLSLYSAVYVEVLTGKFCVVCFSTVSSETIENNESVDL